MKSSISNVETYPKTVNYDSFIPTSDKMKRIIKNACPEMTRQCIMKCYRGNNKITKKVTTPVHGYGEQPENVWGTLAGKRCLGRIHQFILPTVHNTGDVSQHLTFNACVTNTNNGIVATSLGNGYCLITPGASFSGICTNPDLKLLNHTRYPDATRLIVPFKSLKGGVDLSGVVNKKCKNQVKACLHSPNTNGSGLITGSSSYSCTTNTISTVDCGISHQTIQGNVQIPTNTGTFVAQDGHVHYIGTGGTRHHIPIQNISFTMQC